MCRTEREEMELNNKRKRRPSSLPSLDKQELLAPWHCRAASTWQSAAVVLLEAVCCNKKANISLKWTGCWENSDQRDGKLKLAKHNCTENGRHEGQWWKWKWSGRGMETTWGRTRDHHQRRSSSWRHVYLRERFRNLVLVTLYLQNK